MPKNTQEQYVIEVNNVSKDFKIYYDKGYTLKERLLFWKRNRHEVRHILKNISFKVKKGEVLGLIGQNGAGKSTTLKLLSKIIYPTSGNIIMRGRVACLIELGAGFHPDMSGRENIYINASIFGLTKKEIDERIDDIIAFSELKDFIDNPVRTYSSGMYMRLAFSVAINVDADILLIDEILAVGDAAFQAKCFNKLLNIKNAGTTIVIVSHNMGQIEQICDRVIWFNNSKIQEIGSADIVCEVYNKYMADKENGIDDVKGKVVQGERGRNFLRWKIEDESSCTGFDKLEFNGEYKYRWLTEKQGSIYLNGNINYNRETVLKIMYSNVLPLNKSKKLLKVKIELCGYRIAELVCNEGINTVLYDISDVVKHCNKDSLEITLSVNYLWKPCEFIDKNNDNRDLGIVIFNAEIMNV